jgi:hypothetical protein
VDSPDLPATLSLAISGRDKPGNNKMVWSGVVIIKKVAKILVSGKIVAGK